jgi:hypothetical protein
MAKIWSENELTFIKENHEDILLCCEYTQRSESAVKNKAHRIGVNTKKKPAPRFTKEYLEDQYISQCKNLADIGVENNITGPAVARWMKKYNIPLRRGGESHFDFLGQKFGEITITKKLEEKHKNGSLQWLGVCSCGNETVSTTAVLLAGKKRCKPCGHKKVGRDKSKFYEEIKVPYFKKYVWGAESRGLEFLITIEYVWDLFLSQKRKCKLSNKDIKFVDGGLNKETTASLDRIDNSKGYIEGNVQWVDKRINIIKMNLKQEDFINLCKLVAENN